MTSSRASRLVLEVQPYMLCPQILKHEGFSLPYFSLSAHKTRNSHNSKFASTTAFLLRFLRCSLLVTRLATYATPNPQTWRLLFPTSLSAHHHTWDPLLCSDQPSISALCTTPIEAQGLVAGAAAAADAATAGATLAGVVGTVLQGRGCALAALLRTPVGKET
eukprot:1155605-Pelagomonas_calceolata.AAC.2